jgi:hypothetical protein
MLFNRNDVELLISALDCFYSFSIPSPTSTSLNDQLHSNPSTHAHTPSDCCLPTHHTHYLTVGLQVMEERMRLAREKAVARRAADEAKLMQTMSAEERTLLQRLTALRMEIALRDGCSP